jgi:hypothetical protein
MNTYMSAKTRRANIYTLLILLTLFTSCSFSNTTSSGARPTPTLSQAITPRPTPVPVPSLDSALHPAPVFADVPGLHLQSVEGFQCPIRRANPAAPVQGHHLVLGPSADLVLATQRLTYSAAEIQQMRDYIQGIFNNAAAITTSYLVPPPSILRWVAGSSGCELTLQVSNTGNTTIQISSLGVQLTGIPQPNAYLYRAIDVCSLASVFCLAPSGAGDCSVYSASVNLDPQAALGMAFAAQPMSGGSNCPEASLHPGDTLYFRLGLASPGSQPYSTDPYLYAVMPIIKVSDGNGSINTYVLASMAATLAFTDAGHVSCYGLQNPQDTTLTTAPANNPYLGCLG